MLTRVFITLAGLLLASTIQAGIIGSAHDFSTSGWANGEICIACHTPHNSDADISAPLWNRDLSTASYQTYQSIYNAPNGSIFMQGTVHDPGTESLICLSCHDGTIALDSFGGNTGGGEYISGTKLIGTDLSNDHPIGVEWIHQIISFDDTPSEVCTGCHGSPVIVPVDPENMPIPFFMNVDGSARVECASCHDIHNTSDNDFLLRKHNGGSALCKHCHDL